MLFRKEPKRVQEEKIERKCENCRYYSDVKLHLWGTTSEVFHKCSQHSAAGYEEFTYKDSSCERWKKRREKGCLNIFGL